MKHQLAWIVRGARRTQFAFDDQGAAIRDLQQKLAELQLVVARIDSGGAPVDVASGGPRPQLDELSAKLDRIDSTVTELVRVVAPPTTD